MAKNLNCLAFGLWLGSGIVVAQGLADPLRPSGVHVSSTDPAELSDEGPTLQSVIRGAGRRPAAMLSGELVEQGKAWREYRLLKVGEASVVLDGPSGRQTIALTPAVSITPSKPPTVEKTKKMRGGNNTSAGSAP